MRVLATSRPTERATPELLMADTEAEVAKGARALRERPRPAGLHGPGPQPRLMISEAEIVEAVRARLAEHPQVRASLIAFEPVPLIGMPAVHMAEEARGGALPAWWPPP